MPNAQSGPAATPPRSRPSELHLPADPEQVCSELPTPHTPAWLRVEALKRLDESMDEVISVTSGGSVQTSSSDGAVPLSPPGSKLSPSEQATREKYASVFSRLHGDLDLLVLRRPLVGETLVSLLHEVAEALLFRPLSDRPWVTSGELAKAEAHSELHEQAIAGPLERCCEEIRAILAGDARSKLAWSSDSEHPSSKHNVRFSPKAASASERVNPGAAVDDSPSPRELPAEASTGAATAPQKRQRQRFAAGPIMSLQGKPTPSSPGGRTKLKASVSTAPAVASSSGPRTYYLSPSADQARKLRWSTTKVDADAWKLAVAELEQECRDALQASMASLVSRRVSLHFGELHEKLLGHPPAIDLLSVD